MMTHHEMEMLLACVKHYMPQDLRGKVMAELPQAYNSWMGGDYVQVSHVNDPQRIRTIDNAGRN